MVHAHKPWRVVFSSYNLYIQDKIFDQSNQTNLGRPDLHLHFYEGSNN